jgi:hypothetical protein
MNSTKLWVKESRIVWWPSTFMWLENRSIDVFWLKWKIYLYFDEPIPAIPRLNNVLGWSGVAVLFFLVFALWCISEGFWTRG